MFYANELVAGEYYKEYLRLFTEFDMFFSSAQQYRSRSKSVPNVIPPGCNFTVSGSFSY